MRNLIFILTLLLPLSVQAKFTEHTQTTFKGFVTIRPGERRYVEHYPAANGKPTIWPSNGLTWSTAQWDKYVKALKKLDPDIGIVLYDAKGQGRTLLDQAPANYDIPYDYQVQDLKDLYDTLALEGPQVLEGLSYGGGLALKYAAKYPGDFVDYIAWSPYLHPMPSQDLYIRQQIQVVRLNKLNPTFLVLNSMTDDELYDYFLHILVVTQYPLLEPIMFSNPYIPEAVYRMAKGCKNFDAAKIVDQLPAGKVHLVSGDQDNYVTLLEQKAFWESMPKAARGSWMIMKNTGHEMTLDDPEFSAAWTYEILFNDKVRGGAIFNGDPSTGVATSGATTIPMPKVSVCEALLRRVFRPF